ncbi:MAG: hypothetical protein MUO76_20145 [Anaerolineaceae bacterium]|nr:hypothetical protein [Anaerolineaceae bacterium]
MAEKYLSIAKEIFEQFPAYVRGVVLAFDVQNGESPEEIRRMLRDVERFIREEFSDIETIEHPKIASWREAYRSAGMKPGKYRPSIEAMVRRINKNIELPSINSLVDIGNIISLRNLVPVGGHAIDVVEGNIELRPANGDEEFIAFGSNEMEYPNPGEIIYVECNTILTRRWTWRQANHTSTQITTDSIEINIDGLPPVTESNIREICEETSQMVRQYCGGETRYELLTKRHPRMMLNR